MISSVIAIRSSVESDNFGSSERFYRSGSAGLKSHPLLLPRPLPRDIVPRLVLEVRRAEMRNTLAKTLGGRLEMALKLTRGPNKSRS